MEYIAYSQCHNDDYLTQFIALYNTTFPIESEREDTSIWPTQLKSGMQHGYGMDITFAILNHAVVGGIVTEYYPKSGIGLITYLLVDAAHRRNGIGETLFNRAQEAFARLSDGQIVGIVFEAENPQHFDGDEYQKTIKRLHFFATLNAYVIDVNYYQPPLNGRTEGCDLLWLLSVGTDDDTPSITAEQLTQFLIEFYNVLECSLETDTMAQKALDSIPAKLSYTLLRKEECLLNFQMYEAAVAHHWVTSDEHQDGQNWTYPSDPVLRSMELDLMNYAYQINPPFGSETVLETSITIEICFPKMIHYTSEGRRIWYLLDNDVLTVELNLYKTIFPQSQHIIWHSTYQNKHSMSSVDLVKLIHLYDGRTEYTNLLKQTTFRFNGQEYPFQELTSVLSGESHDNIRINGGSMVLSLDESLMTLLTTILDNASDLTTLTDGHEEGILQLSELTGVVTGIFDSDELDINEIRDTIVTAHKTSDALYIYHRSTLLHITEADRSLDQDWIGISPYIFIPQALIIHNDVILQNLIHAINKVDAPNASIEELEDLSNLGDASMEQYFLPNVFMYQTEKRLVEYAFTHRGTHLVMAQAKSRIRDIKELIDMKWDIQQDRGQMLIACVLAAISIISLEPLFTEVLGTSTIVSSIITLILTVLIVWSIRWLWTPKALD